MLEGSESGISHRPERSGPGFPHQWDNALRFLKVPGEAADRMHRRASLHPDLWDGVKCG